MKKRKIKNGQDRPKAFLGESLVAAGITAATSLAAAGIQAAATKESAEKQAQATLEQAQRDAAAMKEINQNNIDLQNQRIQFDKEQNAERNKALLASQMNAQIGGAMQNVDAMKQANRIVAERGKYVYSNSLLRRNLPLSVTDGGVAIPFKQDDDGMIYIMSGDTHKQYHIAPDGKRKTGIGIDIPKFTNKSGKTNLEVQNGELVKVYNNGDTGVLSTQRIAGINPAKTVLQGGDFDTTLIYQEGNKNKNNIKGNRLKAKNGYKNNNHIQKIDIGDIYPYSDKLNYVSNNELNNNNKSYSIQKIDIRDIQPSDKLNYVLSDELNNKPKSIIDDFDKTGEKYSTKDYSNINNSTNSLSSSSGMALGAAGISALGNFGGALITHLGNRNAGRRIEQSQMEAANIMADAYRNLKTIDPNSIKYKDFAAQHAMGVYRAPIMNTNTQITEAARTRDTMIKNSRKNSISAASSFAKNLAANTAFTDYVNQVENKANEYKENVRNQNVATANQMSLQNAQMDNEARRAYMGSRLGILQYNNDIVNQRILGAAGAQAGAKSTIGNTWANIYQANAQGYANALGNTVNTGLGIWNQNNNNRYNLAMVMAGADSDAREQFMKNYRKYLRG